MVVHLTTYHLTPVDGLTRIFAAVKQTPNLKHLPREYQAVIEWGRITYVVSWAAVGQTTHSLFQARGHDLPNVCCLRYCL